MWGVGGGTVRLTLEGALGLPTGLGVRQGPRDPGALEQQPSQARGDRGQRGC